MPVGRSLSEHLVALPVLSAVAVHAIASGAWQLSLAMAALTLIATARARTIARGPHVVIALAVAAVFVVAALAMPEAELSFRAELVGTWTRAVASGALAVAIVAIFARAPVRSRDSPLFFALATVVAGGMARVSASYLPLAVLFVATSALTLVVDREAGPRLRNLGAGRLVAVSLAGLVGVVVTVSLILLLPPANQRVSTWVMGFISLPSTSGMSDSIHLQGSADITLSDEVVLRVRGEGPDLLRGFVMTSYRRGRWSRDRAAMARQMESASLAVGLVNEVVPVKQSMQYFLPLGATSVRLQAGRALRDGMGQWTAPANEIAGPAWFALSPQAQLEPPTASDSAIAPELAAPIGQLARGWLRDAVDPSDRMKALVERLQTDFSYALRHSRKTSADPVLDFLTTQRTGHCEYFASALALLARATGIPARVVTGYRAHEHNPVGGYRVVRERDAHAWVEAWIDGRGWQSFDATPPAYLETMSDRTAWLRGFFDWLSTRQRPELRAVLVWAALPGVPIVILLIGIRYLRSRKMRARSRANLITVPAWPAMQDLMRALARQGRTRPPGETFEHFSRGLRGGGLARAAALVEEYARLRYGGFGGREDLEPKLRAETAVLARERRRS